MGVTGYGSAKRIVKRRPLLPPPLRHIDTPLPPYAGTFEKLSSPFNKKE
jgi:hypothetical protein